MKNAWCKFCKKHTLHNIIRMMGYSVIGRCFECGH